MADVGRIRSCNFDYCSSEFAAIWSISSFCLSAPILVKLFQHPIKFGYYRPQLQTDLHVLGDYVNSAMFGLSKAAAILSYDASGCQTIMCFSLRVLYRGTSSECSPTIAKFGLTRLISDGAESTWDRCCTNSAQIRRKVGRIGRMMCGQTHSCYSGRSLPLIDRLMPHRKFDVSL